VGITDRYQHRFQRIPISYRIAIGNAAVIALGAIGGTIITRHLAAEAADWWLILFFLLVGISLSVLVNFLIIKRALRPLRELSELVQRYQAGQSNLDPQALANPDPDITQLAAALSSLVNQLDERNQQLRALSERAINAQEDERREIALTLHDDTGQLLSMLIINLERLEGQLPMDASGLKNRLAAARDLAQQSLASLRKIVYGLRPTILDDLGLVPAIRWVARTYLEETGIHTEVNASDDLNPLSPQATSTLFRICQEAVNNILRHAKAHNVRISLNQEGTEVSLQVEDDGVGFNVAQASEQAVSLQRLGLLGIQERAQLAGGRVTLESALAKGTRLTVFVPVTEMGG
jgi:two-component system sensor histidine kinase UhpB